MKADIEDIKITNCRCTGNRENFALVLRDNATWNWVTVEDHVCSDGALNNTFQGVSAGLG
jgi:hypothetical protein